MKSDIGIGIIGYGYWGPNLARNFANCPGAKLIAVCDKRPQRLKEARKIYPSVKASASVHNFFRDPAIDAVAIATPLESHFPLAMQALKADKHVLVEKPLAATVGEGERLIGEAERRRRVLMVDHTFVYSPGVQKIRELIHGGNLGRLYYYDSVRVNLGLFQHKTNVLWDLAVHDLAILDYVLGKEPHAVSAVGCAHLPAAPIDVAYMTCFFEDNLIAHFHVNWLAPVKVRRTLIGGDNKMIVYDDLAPDEKVRVYDKGVLVNNGADTRYRQMVDYRIGDMWAPHLDRTEALTQETRHFVECIDKGRAPLTGGESGLRVVRILEAADRSLSLQGRRVDLAERRIRANASGKSRA